jgi:hypothetical protein
MRWLLWWLGASLVFSHAAVAAEGGCVQSQGVTTNRYIEALKSDARNGANAIFHQVPSDLTLVPESAAYVASGDVALHQLPLETSPTNGGLKRGERFMSTCRVTGPAGDAWLAIRSPDATLLYVSESRTAKVSASDAAAGAEPEKRSHDPLLQGRY